MPKQLLNNSKTTFKKSKKRLFGPQNGQMTLSERQIVTYNFYFTRHISTFRAKNTPKSKSFKTKNRFFDLKTFRGHNISTFRAKNTPKS